MYWGVCLFARLSSRKKASGSPDLSLDMSLASNT